MRPLNPRQESFAQGLAQGMTQLDAYRAAGYRVGQTRGGQANAANLARKPQIRERVRAIQSLVTSASMLTILEKRQWCARLVRGETEASTTDILKAMDLDNRLAGHYEPEKIDWKYTVVIGEEDGPQPVLEADEVEAPATQLTVG